MTNEDKLKKVDIKAIKLAWLSKRAEPSQLYRNEKGIKSKNDQKKVTNEDKLKKAKK